MQWERYQARLKFQRDQAMFLKDARETGLKEGRQEGIKEGRQEGIKEGLKEGLVGEIHLCERLLKLPLTPAEELLALSLEELRARIAALERQLGLAKE